jgi:hypothetical protein
VQGSVPSIVHTVQLGAGLWAAHARALPREQAEHHGRIALGGGEVEGVVVALVHLVVGLAHDKTVTITTTATAATSAVAGIVALDAFAALAFLGQSRRI